MLSICICLCICVFVFLTRLLHEGSAKRVGVVRHNSTSAAHLNGLDASINTAAAIQGRGVNGALWGRLSAQSDVTALTPGGSPRVLDQPEVALSRVSSVSDQGDGMVHHHVAVVVASIEDTTVVGAPVRGGHGGGEGALSGEMVHQSGGIIVGKSLEAHGHHSGVRGCCVKLADIVVASASTCIGIVVFCDNSEERCVGVGQRLNGSHTAAGASTLKWVGDTADKVLGAQFDQIVSHVVDLGIGSQDGGGSKSPAGPTSSLVPHHGDDSLVPPVNRLGQIGNLCLQVVKVDRLA